MAIPSRASLEALDYTYLGQPFCDVMAGGAADFVYLGQPIYPVGESVSQWHTVETAVSGEESSRLVLPRVREAATLENAITATPVTIIRARIASALEASITATLPHDAAPQASGLVDAVTSAVWNVTALFVPHHTIDAATADSASSIRDRLASSSDVVTAGTSASALKATQNGATINSACGEASSAGVFRPLSQDVDSITLDLSAATRFRPASISEAASSSDVPYTTRVRNASVNASSVTAAQHPVRATFGLRGSEGATAGESNGQEQSFAVHHVVDAVAGATHGATRYRGATSVENAFSADAQHGYGTYGLTGAAVATAVEAQTIARFLFGSSVSSAVADAAAENGIWVYGSVSEAVSTATDCATTSLLPGDLFADIEIGPTISMEFGIYGPS